MVLSDVIVHEIKCDCYGSGVHEIKCPFTHNNPTAHEAASTDFKSEDGPHILYPNSIQMHVL